ncbi:MAG TPA: ATP-binding cassette domain-containing protein [Acetomicrobium sp.]|uniref:ABC transporter ATP-binding protein n=1 Tax=Acetomicrobium TaxID=49894 RepID=UPI0026F1E75C|nr:MULTISPECIES: ATP-binding cassette domain-containing protein [Acetomicrobium]HPT65631.1 ATP-binding cassette domain-containing protein [Acetomicrobium sp.]
MTEEVLRLEEVIKSFGDNVVLKNLSFSVKKGEIIALMGPSGCGKTTVLRLVLRLIEADEGRVWLYGRDITHLPERDLIDIRRKVGIVFQGGALFDSMTVFENVAFPLRYCLGIKDEEKMRDMIAMMLESVELPGIEDLMPADLSGGMRKRVALARALVYNPSFLLLDEPTTGLDPQTARHIDRLVVNLSKKYNVSAMAVTHDVVSALGVADRILLMKDGRIAWLGTPEEWETATDPEVVSFLQGTKSIRQWGCAP